MTDDAAPELAAAFIIQVLETVERQNIVIRGLLAAHETQWRPASAVVQQYREQCDGVAERVRKLRAMLATLTRQM